MTRSIFRSQQCLMDPSRFARCGPQLHEGQGFFGGVIKPPSVSNYPSMKLRLQEEITDADYFCLTTVTMVADALPSRGLFDGRCALP